MQRENAARARRIDARNTLRVGVRAIASRASSSAYWAVKNNLGRRSPGLDRVKSKGSRPARVNRIGRKLAARFERQRRTLKGAMRKKPFARKQRKPKLHRLIAYDLETTRIEAGTPKALYVTAFCNDWSLSSTIRDTAHFLEILQVHFLTSTFVNARFVAWNGNNYDVFFIAKALLLSDLYVLRPYLTRSKALRGLRVTLKADKRQSWEFLDGLSMTGLGSTPLRSLKAFLKVFAPEFHKLAAPDWEHETFNAKNREHVLYAERDSEGLYHGLLAFESIMQTHFKMPLQPTIGNAGIKIFQAHIPEDVAIWEPNYHATQMIRETVMRGGYCMYAGKYQGPVWKYDINQAYAAAMRDALLPAGSCVHARGLHPYAKTGIYRVRGTAPKNKNNMIPFYYRNLEKVACFAFNEITETWLTTIEINQLKAERWNLEILEGYFWDDQFSMREYVDKLEDLRVNAPGGPAGAQGLIMKCIGNNSYGKTVEQLDGVELVLANECPEGFYEYQDAEDLLECIWMKFGTPVLREYHQPQLGAFITAHVRMEVRRAALLAPAAWLYADTDCVMFSEPVAGDAYFKKHGRQGLAIDASKYGKWKIEEEGRDYWIINKKVYGRTDGAKNKDGKFVTAHAKGMNVNRLTAQDFEAWFDGRPPTQTQVQRQNFVKVMTGAEMFAERTKVGERLNL